jgi:hypothetical protein
MLNPHIGLANWRTALIIVGLPGLFLAVLVAFTMREPARITASNEARDAGDFGPFVRYLSDNRRLYLPFYVGVMAFGVFAIAAVSWVPSLLVRGFALEPATAGLWIGTVGSLAGFSGTFFGRGWLPEWHAVKSVARSLAQWRWLARCSFLGLA